LEPVDDDDDLIAGDTKSTGGGVEANR